MATHSRILALKTPWADSHLRTEHGTSLETPGISVLTTNPYISTKIGLNWRIPPFDLNIMVQTVKYHSYGLTYVSYTFRLISHFCVCVRSVVLSMAC